MGTALLTLPKSKHILRNFQGMLIPGREAVEGHQPCENEGRMNVFELIIFLLICAVIGFVGYLVSPRYGWFAGLGPAVLVLILLLIGSFKEIIMGSRAQHKNRNE
jgi:hypothetical protein